MALNQKDFFLLLFLPGPLTTAIVKLAATCVCENFAFKIFYIFSLDSAVGGKSAFIPKNKQLLLQNSASVFFKLLLFLLFNIVPFLRLILYLKFGLILKNWSFYFWRLNANVTNTSLIFNFMKCSLLHAVRVLAFWGVSITKSSSSLLCSLLQPTAFCLIYFCLPYDFLLYLPKVCISAECIMGL